MKKSTFLILIALMTMGSVFAQTLPEGMEMLLPDGVQGRIDNSRREVQNKNLMVAGSPSKGYLAYFTAIDATHGEELWVTDGTPAGTKMVKDINPGAGSSNVSWMNRFNDKVVFAATDGVNNTQLWISDGTESGTKMVKIIHEFGDSNPRGFTQVNENQFIFAAMDFESENYSAAGKQFWLYVSDGTEEGTELIYECDVRWPGVESYNYYNHFCRVGRKVFFKADNKDNTVGEEVWVTDGTREGTRHIKDINLEPNGRGGTLRCVPDNFANFYNEKLFFKAWSLDYGNEIWASDGTEEGTYIIEDTNPTFDDNGLPRGGGAGDHGKYPYKGKFYYRAWSQTYGCEFGATDLTPGPPGHIDFWDINTNDPTNENHSYADTGVEFDGVYMFCANSGTRTGEGYEHNVGGELRYCDGENVYLQYDLAPGILHMWIKELTVSGGSLYWWNESTQLAEQNTKLFRLDYKDAIPERVTNLRPDGDKIHTLRNLDGLLLFCSRLADGSDELYAYYYRKDGYDAERDADNMERDLEFRTRSEMTGINPVTAPTPKLIIYPNPATVRINFNVEGVSDVKIFDLAGRLVKAESRPAGNSVNVSSLRRGIYQIVITTATDRYVSKLVMK